MANSLRDEKITEFFQSIFKRHADDEDLVKYDQLDAILTSLGRKVSPERISKIRKKFDTENTNVVNFKDPEFIMTVASLNVVDVKAIEDCVLEAAFKIFDMDEDGKISLHEMRIVLSLFLPVQIQQEQESVESTIYTMDTMRDGEIRLGDFVKGVREAGSFRLRRSVEVIHGHENIYPSFYRYKEEIMLASLMVAGFIIYQILSECGMLPVIGFYEGPLGA